MTRAMLVGVGLFLLTLSSAGCGAWFPHVRTAADVANVDPQTRGLTARPLSDADIPSLVRLPNVEFLDFWKGWADVDAKITDRGLEQLAKLQLPSLRWLCLGRCTRITDAGMVYVAQMKGIHRLALPQCTGITDAALTPLLTMDLELLDLRLCPGIDDKSVASLSKMQGLKDLWIGGCDNLSPAARMAIRQALPLCRVDDDDYMAHMSCEGADSAWVKAHHDEEMQKRKQGEQAQGVK